MKPRTELLRAVCVLPILCLLPTLGLADSASVREEVVDADGQVVGFIDWTEAAVYGRGDGVDLAAATAEARKTLYQVLLVVAVDDASCVGDHVRRYHGLGEDLRALTGRAARGRSYAMEAGHRVYVKAPLFGRAGLYATVMQPRLVRVDVADHAAPGNPAAVGPNRPTPPDLAAVQPDVGSHGGATASVPEPGLTTPGGAAVRADTPRPPGASGARTQPQHREGTLAPAGITPGSGGKPTRPGRGKPLPSGAQPPRAEGKPVVPSLARIAASASMPTGALPSPRQQSPTVPSLPAKPASATRPQPPGTVLREHRPSPDEANPPAASSEPQVAPTPEFPPLDVPDEGPFTGLLVDARGLGLKRSISPQIVSESGQVVYGHFADMTPEQRAFAHNTGIVSYLPDPAFARRSRAGAHPLVVRGLRVEGVSKGNVVIGNGDATRVKAEDRKTKFLDEMNVAVLK